VDSESPELIEQEMHKTRQSLTDKVAALEQQVVGTIQSATSVVQDTVESVKSAVHETVASVKDTVEDVKDTVEESVSNVQEGVMHTLDVGARVRENPWTMLGGATAAGFVTGLLVFRGRLAGTSSLFGALPFTGTPTYARANSPVHAPPAAATPPQPREQQPVAEPRRPGWVDELLDMAGREAKKLGEAALASVVASLQQNINQNLPHLIDNLLHVPNRAESGAAGQRANGSHPSSPRTV